MVYRNRMLHSLLLFCGAISAFGQTLENVKAAFDGEKMVITYDLGFTDANQKFKVAFYSSHDNFARPLSSTTGDVGESVHVGKSNKVIWDVKNTLPPDFDGEITIKIKTNKVLAAAPSATKLSLKPLDKNVYKKGQSVEVKWQGGSPDEKVNIELYRGSELKLRLADKISNSQMHTWKIPKGVKGKDYTLRISNAANATELSNSQEFAVKPKVPILFIILPVAVAGGLVAILGTEPPPPANENLPGPVKPN